MRLTLLRHGLAVDREDWTGPDPLRPLTSAGQVRTRDVCRALRRLIRAERILHSPWLRAAQTAEIAARVWDLPTEEVPWLAGELFAPVATIAKLPPGDLVLVGHEPDLGALCGALMGAGPVALKKAGVAILEGKPHPGGMVLTALLSPKVVLGIH